jgi:hypothetical protein
LESHLNFRSALAPLVSIEILADILKKQTFFDKGCFLFLSGCHHWENPKTGLSLTKKAHDDKAQVVLY